MGKLLAKVIKNALSGNGCKLGAKRVLDSVRSKNSKLVVCSSSLPEDVMGRIRDAAKSSRIQVYEFEDTSVELGKLCNKPFRISALSINAATDSDISALLEEINKEGETKK